MTRPMEPTRDPPVGPGDRVGKYTLTAELGRGGMGVVYEARDGQLGRKVAIKCPWPEFAVDPDHRARFLREARIASRLTHSGIVPLLEVLEDHSLPWLVMPKIEGESLRARLDREGRLSLDRALRYAETMAQALHHAHAHNILHRDITPKNVLLNDDDEPLLTDFGLARYVTPPDSDSMMSTEISAHTGTGVIMGTPRYMSPEQILGRDVDARSDVFSLGVVLYEMVCGAPPFLGDDAGDLRGSIVYRSPESMTRCLGRRTAGLDRIVARCLAKDPAKRYASAGELASDLHRIRVRYESRRRTILFGGIAATSLALAAGAAVLAVRGLGIVVEGLGGTPLRLTTNPGWEGEPAVSPDGDLVAYVGETDGRRDLYLADSGGGAVRRLTDDEAAEYDPFWFPDGRDLAFTRVNGNDFGVCRMSQLGGAVTLLIPRAQQAGVSPDGAMLAFSRIDSSGMYRIWVCPSARPDSVRQLTTAADGLWEHRYPSWSPDGEWICYSTQDGIWKVEASGGPAVPVLQDFQDHGRAVWSADGAELLFDSYREKMLAVWSVPAKGGAPRRLTTGSGSESRPSLSRDGSVLAYGTGGFETSLETLHWFSRDIHILPGLNEAWMPTLSPDGTVLVFVAERLGLGSELWAQAMRDGEPEGEPYRIGAGLRGIPSHPRFAPDGKRLALYTIDEGRRNVWILDVPTRRAWPATDHPEPDTHPDWSPDGTRIVYCAERGGQSDLYVIPAVGPENPLGEPMRLTNDPATEAGPAWSPDGERIAYVAVTETATEVWMVPVDGSEPPRQVTDGITASRVRWGAAGDRLYVTGRWRRDGISLGILVPAESGGWTATGSVVQIGTNETSGIFDVNADGTVVVYCRTTTPHGDIWVLRR